LATILFTDVVDSTKQAASEMGCTAAAAPRPCAKELARFRNREANAAGDRFLIAFDGPGRAHPLWDEHLAAGTLVGHRHRVETLFP
jgi:class 3 adenylate cyclase